MRQSKFRYLFGGMTLACITVLLLWILGIPSPISVRCVVNPAQTTATTVWPLYTTLDGDSYETLVTHFEKTSSRVLEIAKWVVIIVGTLGGASGAYSIFETMKIQDLRNETAGLETKISNLKDELEESRQLNEESRQLSMDTTNRFRYLREVRDRNYEVRTRAAQQLGASNDIAAISILMDLLENDRSVNVKLEAAYGLGQLLSQGGEPGTLEEGIQALLAGTKDSSEKVRVEAVEALDTLVCNNIELPRIVHRKMQEIVECDAIEDVVKAAEETLKHLKQQRERKLNSPGPENN